MGKIEKWVANQLPDIGPQLEVVNGVDFLHISVDAKIKKMRPRIGDRQMKMEDRTIPRICGSETLVGCILGHAGVRAYYLDALFRDKAGGWKNGVFTIYRAKVDNFVRPGKKLVADAKLTNELWIVPYAPECYEVEVEPVGQFYLHSTVDRILDGVNTVENVFYLSTYDDIILDDGVTMKVGYYSFGLSGELLLTTASTMKDVPKATDLAPITRTEWTASLQKLKKYIGGAG